MNANPRVSEGLFNVAPPISGKVVRFATPGSSTRYNVPTAWKGHFVTFTTVTTAIQLAFGGASASLTADQASAVASEDITANAASGFTITPGTYHRFYIETDQTDFVVIAANTNGFWEAYVSDRLP